MSGITEKLTCTFSFFFSPDLLHEKMMPAVFNCEFRILANFLVIFEEQLEA